MGTGPCHHSIILFLRMHHDAAEKWKQQDYKSSERFHRLNTFNV